MKTSPSLLSQLLLPATGVLGAFSVDFDNADSVKAAASQVADDLLSTFYHGTESGRIPGLLDGPPPDGDYYWWAGGAVWDTLIDLRSRTGNTTYDDIILQGMQFQLGDGNDYLPANWSSTEGNDDQGAWALAAMLASETGFQDPASTKWVTVAENVFNEQTSRLTSDAGNCSSALRWQIFTFNNGYNYVNSAANGMYFRLGAQLARATSNQTYSDSASKVYDALVTMGLIAEDFSVYDGLQLEECDSISRVQFTYTAGLILEGAAYMYNVTDGSSTWKKRVDGLTENILKTFFANGTAVEVSCETVGTCNTDMEFFKGYLHRALAVTTQVAPYTAASILPLLKTSAAAAIKTCSGGDNGRMCGLDWSTGAADNSTKAGSQLSVLGALVSVMQAQTTVASTGTSGGSTSGSTGGSTTGSGSNNSTTPKQNAGVTAGISFTALVGGLLVTLLG